MAYSEYFPIKPNIINSCPACVEQIPIRHKDQVQVGDHIISRSTHCDHHLIVVEKHESTADSVEVTVIHSTPTVESDTNGKTKKGSLHKDKKIISLDGKFLTVSYMCPVVSKTDVAMRAIQRFKNNTSGSQEQYDYDLKESNCEHFATWCVTDRYFSFQVFQALPGIFARNNASYLCSMHTRNELCDTCYKRLLVTVLHVPWKYTTPDKVKIGDIVSYFYYWIWHDAVVLEAWNGTKLVLAHYGTDGLFSTRTIMKETVDFRDKTLAVYNYDGWAVYPPMEVVRRAESRVGEIKWAMTFNRSVHFTRWCKVRLSED